MFANAMFVVSFRRWVWILVGVVTCSPSSADHWTQFRGPEANAISPVPLPVVWSAGEGGDRDDDSDGNNGGNSGGNNGGRINLLWKVPVQGEGWSQPIVWEDQVIMTTAVPEMDEAATDADLGPEPYLGGGGRSRGDLMTVNYRYEVVSLDADTGDELWRTRCKVGRPPVPRHSTNTYATETPATDGQRIYAYFGMNGVYALDMRGELVWEKDLGVYEMRADWGTASSPALFDGRLYLQVDNQVDSFLVALDAKTGNELWRVARDEKSQYSTPMIWTHSQRSELIVGGMIYRSYDPATGNLLWQLDMAKGRSSATPVAIGDRLFIGTELKNRGGDDDGGGRLFCVRPGGVGDITPPEDASSTDVIAWWIEGADLQMASPTVCDGKLYLFERRTANMHCIDASNGETVYRQRVRGAKAFWASPWTDGRHVYALDASGTTHVITSGDEYELVAANELDEQAWGTPGLANGRIYLRTVEHLHCIADDVPLAK